MVEIVDKLRSRLVFHADQVEQLAFELAFELEEAKLGRNDLVSVNRDKLRAVAIRVLSRTCANLEALKSENEDFRAGIKRLSDEEEFCAETTGDNPFSMVHLAAKLAASEQRIKELTTERHVLCSIAFIGPDDVAEAALEAIRAVLSAAPEPSL